MWRPGLLYLAIAACSGADDPTAARSYAFGPYTVGAAEEVSDQCVQITLNNDEPMFVNQVELTTGPGFHHSNWMFVPEHVFAGDDGTFTCDDRAFNQPVAAIFGGVLFAQSTQSTQEVQSFPAGVAIKIPPHSKLVATIHLLNPGDEAVTVTPTIALGPIAELDVVKTLAGVSFEYHALALPPRKRSSFSVECDLVPQHQFRFGRDPDFQLYYGLAHYHQFGTGLTFEAVRPDGAATPIFTTTGAVGDALGGTLDPAFDMTGFTRLRMTCDYYNNTDATIRWGNGDGEMCAFLGFSDSTYNWGGGVIDDDENPGTPSDVDGVMRYARGCQVFTNDATH